MNSNVLCRCVLCHKEMSFLPVWVPPGTLLLPALAGMALCGACRRRLVAGLPEESTLRHIRARDVTCSLCKNVFTTTNRKTGGIWLVEIAPEIFICDNCLRGVKETQEKQVAPASNESNAS